MKCRYEGNGVWVGRCTGTKDVDPCLGYDKCKSYKPCYGTNADRIRAMTDEELAGCSLVCPHQIDEYFCTSGKSCFACRLDWLQQPAEEG